MANLRSYSAINIKEEIKQDIAKVVKDIEDVNKDIKKVEADISNVVETLAKGGLSEHDKAFHRRHLEQLGRNLEQLRTDKQQLRDQLKTDKQQLGDQLKTDKQLAWKNVWRLWWCAKGKHVA